MPACGDDKKAIDDYTSEIGMGGRNTLAIYNTVRFSMPYPLVSPELIRS